MALDSMMEQGKSLLKRFKTSGKQPQYDPTAKSLDYQLDSDIKTDADILGFVELRYTGFESYMWAIHRQWYEGLLWYYGEHYLEYDYHFKRFISKPTRQFIPRAVNNLILDHVERAASFLQKNRPRGRVLPQGSDIVSIEAAKRADRVRDYKWELDNMDMKLREAALWAVITGNAMLQTNIDKSNKPRVPIPTRGEDGNPVIDPETGEPAFETVRLSDYDTEVINPMEVVPDWGARYPFKMRHYLHHRAEDIDWIKDTFGSKAGIVSAEASLFTNSYYQFKTLDLISRASYSGQRAYGYGLASGSGEYQKMRHAAIVKTWYELPRDGVPNGRMWVVANGRVLYKGGYPYGDKLNLHWFRWSHLPGNLFGFGMVRSLIDPQKRLNGLATQVALNRKTVGNPGWLVPKGSAFSEGLGTNEPGHVYSFRPSPKLHGSVPQRLPPSDMSQDAWREYETTERHMNNISGMQDILRGENPPGVTAGVSLELLSEQASGRFAPAIDDYRATVVNCEQFRLGLIPKSALWVAGVRIFDQDEEGIAQSLEVTANDLPPNPRIKVEAAPAVLWSQAAKKANSVEAANLGLIDLTQPLNRRKMREVLSSSEFDDEWGPNVKLAEWENQQFLGGKGEEIAVRAFEDPQIHLPLHVKITLRPDYVDLPKEIRLSIERHISKTKERLAQLLAMQEEATAPSAAEMPEQGGAGGSPESPGAQPAGGESGA
jgi:hypothetical protein